MAVIARIVLILVVAALVAGCGGAAGGATGRTTVAASFYPLAFAAERIGGSSVDVENLTPPGAEPHDVELAPRTVARVQQADVVLHLGREFQPAVADAAADAQGRVVNLLPNGGDPHVWLDPVGFERIAERIGVVLRRPSHIFVAELARLDRSYRRSLAQCERHEIVTTHEAFAYLSRRYGLKQVAITGITPEAEPSPSQLARVIRTVRETHATTVFFEPLVSRRLAQTVARATGAHTAELDPIESSEQGQTYFTLMRRNLQALRQALGCR